MSVAETVAPAVRGRGRTKAVTALGAAAGLTGAATGATAGALWAVTGLDAPSATVVADIVVVAVAFDITAVRAGWLTAPSVRRQVPVEWGRILSPPTAAALYGARLGVGPLTVLNTWLWWAMALVAAFAGPWWAAAVGGWFGVSRSLATVAAGPRSAAAGPARAATLARLEGRWGNGLRLAALLVAVAVVAAGCGDDAGDPTAPAGRQPTPTSTTSTTVTAHPLDDELSAAALAEPPAGGFRLTAEGALDLDAAVALEDDRPAERAVLETREFVRGYRRVWEREGEVAAVFVYQFAEPVGAEAYLTDGLVTLEGFGARLIDVEEVAGALGFAQGAADESGAAVAYGAVFTRGPRFFLVLRTGPSSATSPGDLRAFAAAQAAHLTS